MIESETAFDAPGEVAHSFGLQLREGLPIASGVAETACKTLVTQRMKQSGMPWGQVGGQAVLTLRSLIRSNRWEQAWALLHADFCKPVDIVKTQHDPYDRAVNSHPPTSIWRRL